MAAPSSDRQHNALQVIFAFFLGLMLTAFIGIGVNTFYPAPWDRADDELQSLYRQQEDIEISRGTDGELSAAQEAELRAIREDIRELEDSRRDSEEGWSRNTSIVLIIFATLAMGVSLVRSEELRIISNGLLLGGVFTMLYGTGWVIASGSSVARFGVMTFALIITFALGYARFVRDKAASSAEKGGVPAAAAAGAVPAELEERLSALESRMSAAAALLAGEKDRD